MNLIDILVIAAIGFGAWRGFKNGVIYEVAGLMAIIVGIWAGMRLAFIVANWYRDHTEIPENIVPVLAFLTAFAVGLGVVLLVGKVVTTMFKVVQLGLVNRIAGAVFGGAKWAFLLGTLLSVIGNSDIISKDTRENSASYPILNSYCTNVQEYSIGLLPFAENIFGEMEDYFIGLDSMRSAKSVAPDSNQTKTP